MSPSLLRLALAHSRVELGILRLWLLRERAWGHAIQEGLRL